MQIYGIYLEQVKRILLLVRNKGLSNYTETNIIKYTIDVEIDDGPGAFFRLKEGHVLAVIHKEVLCQDSGASGVADDVEVFLYVGISVGVVGPEPVAQQMVFRGFVQARCQSVGLSLSPGCEATPAPGIEPILAVSGGVNVDGGENHLIVPEQPADGVYAAAALLQGDVLAFRTMSWQSRPREESLSLIRKAR